MIKNIPSWQYDAAMSKKPYPSETQDRYIVRFPDGMRERIKDAAEASGRSMNSQIVFMLQSFFDDIDDGLSPVKGTKAEQQSYFSQVVGTWPLTALLTSEEIDKLAARMTEITGAHKAVGNPVSKPTKESK